MKLEGDYVFNGPRQEVWEMLNDPNVLATCLPGTQSLNKTSENEYEGTINVRIGPVNGAFSGKLVVSDQVPPKTCTLTVEGRGAPGFAKGVGHVVLEEQADNKTFFKYDGDVQIGGKLASVGQRLFDSVAKSMVRQGLEAMDKALEARMASKKGEQVDFKAPTESQFAAGVAKDMGKSITKIAEVRMFGYVVTMALLLFAIAFILNKCSGG
jgi:carbon monoxide dehydrogenase subunit G